MAYQRVMLTLDIKRHTVHASILETLKHFAYLLGVERYKEAQNRFDGEKASPRIRKLFHELMTSTLDDPTWKHSSIQEGPGYFRLEASFISTLSYEGAFELLHLLRHHFRCEANRPIIIVHVEGRNTYFVHMVNAKRELYHCIVPFTDSINLQTPHDVLAERVAEYIAANHKEEAI